MYASQNRFNTKYTDFIRNYFPEDTGTHDVIIHNNDKLPLNKQSSVLLAQSDPSLLISSDNKKTKFSDLFSRNSKKHSSNRSFSKDPRFEKLESRSGRGGGGDSVPKTYSDPNLINLHKRVVNSFNNNNDDYRRSSSLAAGRNETNTNVSLNSSTNPTELLRDLERNLQKLNEETIQLLNRAKSESVAHLEDVVTQAGSENVSYHEVLKAEHVALRRELLNNIREISRATFYDDLYAKNNNTNGEEQSKSEGAFHLNQDTADPKERVDEWIRSSQEHLNKPRRRRSHSAANSSEFHRHHQAAADKPALHASLFHESSAWHNEDEPDVPTEDFVEEEPPAAAPVRSKPPVKRSERVVGAKKPVIFNNFIASPPTRHGKSVQCQGDCAPNGSMVTRRNSAPRKHQYPQHAQAPPASFLNPPSSAASAFKTLQVFASQGANPGRSNLSDALYGSSEDTDQESIRRRPFKRVQSLAIIPQPATEKFPNRIFRARKRYVSVGKQNGAAVAPKPNRLFQARRSKSLDNARNRQSNESNLTNALPQVESQTVGYAKNKKTKGTQVPGILRRSNMDQWVAKKVWFYVNGDEHRPKFEFRFRPKRDVKDLDTLCDILTKRINLTRGVRYIFTMDGHLIESLDDLENERHYVVSSTKKFKVTPYKDYFAPPKQPVSFRDKNPRQSL